MRVSACVCLPNIYSLTRSFLSLEDLIMFFVKTRGLLKHGKFPHVGDCNPI